MGKVLNADTQQLLLPVRGSSAPIGYKFNKKIKIRTCNYQKVPTYSEIISISLSTKGDKFYIVLIYTTYFDENEDVLS